MTPVTIYFIRHATPDWARRDLAYHTPPGPPLTQQGEHEAAQLGLFLRDMRVAQLYASPLERCRRTAEIAGSMTDIPFTVTDSLREVQPGEKADALRARLWPLWEHTQAASLAEGPQAWVTHGGPIAVMLSVLGMPANAIDKLKRQYDGGNPAPPAGAWRALRYTADMPWDLTLAFVPTDAQGKKWLI